MTGKRSPTSSHTNTAAWKKLRKQILSTNPPCATCGAPADTLDHITPAALGGTPTIDNVRPMCATCNKRRGGQLGNKLKGKKVRQPVDSHRGFSTGATRSGSRQFQNAPNIGNRFQLEPMLHGDGWIMPRLETPRPDDVVGSMGEDAADWIDAETVVGGPLMGWQRHVLDRALEVRADGSLRWPVVVVSVARQSGKSWLLRGLAWWRMHASERFGETQTVLHVANKSLTARECWEPAARLASDKYGTVKTGMKGRERRVAEVRFSTGQESIALPDGSRWLVMAATPNAGVGYSISLAIVDEAFSVKRNVVESSISPTMAARNNPQLWLVSTAGDTGSDLLRSYREAALADPSGEVLLLEWSSPPEAPYDEPETWRWASPAWDDRREKFLRSRVAAMPSTEFASQFNNQWQVSLNPWLPPDVWKACGVSRLAWPTGKDSPVVAVESSMVDGRLSAVVAWKRGDRVAVRSHMTESPAGMWAWIDKFRPARVLLPPPLEVHYPGNPQRVGIVTAGTIRTLLPGVTRSIRGRDVVFHRDDEYLTAHVLAAVSVGNTDGGMSLSTARAASPTEACRAMVWAVGEVLRPASPKPRVVTG